MTSPLQGNGAMVAILADPGYSMKERFAFAIRLLFLKQRVISMLDYATLQGKILLMCGLMREQYLQHTTSEEKKELREYILKRRRDFGYNFVKHVIAWIITHRTLTLWRSWLLYDFSHFSLVVFSLS